MGHIHSHKGAEYLVKIGAHRWIPEERGARGERGRIGIIDPDVSAFALLFGTKSTSEFGRRENTYAMQSEVYF